MSSVVCVFEDENLMYHIAIVGGMKVVAVLRGVNTNCARAVRHIRRPTLVELAVPEYEFGHWVMKDKEGIPTQQYIDVSEHPSFRRFVRMSLPVLKLEYQRIAHKFFLSDQVDRIMRRLLVLRQWQMKLLRVNGSMLKGIKSNSTVDGVRKALRHTGGVWSLLARRDRVLKGRRPHVEINLGHDHDRAVARLSELFETDTLLSGIPNCVKARVLRKVSNMS
jgi:hypothetical protein